MTWHRKIPGQAACGPCCGLKEKLQTLWDRTINSILRINQVEPDDQGNIKITSDSEALTVSEGTNEIILGLDTSELPAAAVSSVNGMSGDVIVAAGDIPSNSTRGVQGDINTLYTETGNNTAAINAEVLARQNADTALQNNINALQASIPTEAAAAVAADPTVLSFAAAAADIPNKVDKRTGSGLRAYTHDGSTQDDTPVIDGTTGTTIPIRDSNGRLQAADPAAGATDKTLVTANWVSQTGAGRPNNLIHDSGNEIVNGTKTCINPQYLKSVSSYYRNTDAKNGWIEVYNFTQNVTSFLIEIMGNSSNDVGYYSKFFITAISPTKGWISFIDSAYQNTAQRIEVLLTHDGTKYGIWCKFVTYRYANVSILRSGRYGTEANTDIVEINGTDHGATKPTAPDYTVIADEVNP